MRRLSGYRVFLTRNTEYHVRGHVCFGVRDRRSGAFRSDHWALGQRLAAAFPDARGKMHSLSSPVIGEPLWFDVAAGSHCTSPVLAIEDRECFEMPVAQPRPRTVPPQAANPKDTY